MSENSNHAQHVQADPDELLDDRAAGHELGGVPIGTLRNWRSVGTGPRYVKVGRIVRYRRRDLQAWIESRIVDPAARAS